MESYVKHNNQVFHLEFFESYHDFFEDFELNMKHYTSIDEVNADDLKTLIFCLHYNVAKIRSENINSDIIDKYELSSYGDGPNYDDDNYYILSGTFVITNILKDFVILNDDSSNDKLHIHKNELDYFSIHSNEFEIGNLINFEGMESNIFVDNKMNIIRELLIDIDNLNKLFIELKTGIKIIIKN